jgi:hypothetical protein
VYISKEIIQSEDMEKSSLVERQSHLMQAMFIPTDKFSHRKAWFSSSRLYEDYWFHPTLKRWRTMQCVGFSVNSEYLDGINWFQLHKISNIKPRGIIYIRSNIVKQMVSGITGQNIKRTCGSSNLRDSSDCLTSSASHSTVFYKSALTSSSVHYHPNNQTYTIPLSTFVNELDRWIIRNKQMLQYANTALMTNDVGSNRVEEWKFLQVQYEDIVANPHNEFDTIAKFLELDLDYYQIEEILKSSNHFSISSFFFQDWKKRSSNSLKDIINNYRILEQTLNQETKDSFDCMVILDMLQDNSYRSYPITIDFLTHMQTCIATLRTKFYIYDYLKEAEAEEENEVAQDPYLP